MYSCACIVAAICISICKCVETSIYVCCCGRPHALSLMYDIIYIYGTQSDESALTQVFKSNPRPDRFCSKKSRSRCRHHTVEPAAVCGTFCFSRQSVVHMHPISVVLMYAPFPASVWRDSRFWGRLKVRARLTSRTSVNA